MIELPEALAIARQLNREVCGKPISSASGGSSPHKWVFYTPPREELEKELPGRTLGEASAVGRGIHISMSSKRVLVIDDFGGRVTYHEAGGLLPKKYHLHLQFDDDSGLTVAIQGWGFIALLTQDRLAEHAQARAHALSPVGKTFTLQGFEELFERHEEAHTDSVKTFFTNGKNVAGIGNGYLQDILFRARIHPRRKVGQITRSERRALYGAVKDTVSTAVSLGGRESERDLYGRPGNYRPLMDRHARGKPCSVCGLPIEKISYLGGSCYVCPACQT